MNARAVTAPQRLDGVHFPNARSWSLTLHGGQCFRWQPLDATGFRGTWNHHVVEVWREADGGVCWQALTTRTTVADLQKYFAADIDFAALADALPWRSDAVLAAAREALVGLRLLRQPLGETLLCYLCSATKRVEQIRVICERLAERFGDPLPGGFALPSWERLAEVSDPALRSCGLGYRARHIVGTAAVLESYPTWEADLARTTTDEARAFLMDLPGVGRKIADCVLLYGLGRREVFPVDTWVTQCLTRRYRLDGWSPAQIAHFAAIHFGAGAGLAQQWLFEGERLKLFPEGLPPVVGVQ